MKLRIIKEESVYRIQEFSGVGLVTSSTWKYANKAYTYSGTGVVLNSSRLDFKTKKEAEEFIEHHYTIKVVKEYEVETK